MRWEGGWWGKDGGGGVVGVGGGGGAGVGVGGGGVEGHCGYFCR